jgi:hypothetical protein
MAVAWGWLVERVQPDRWDVIGACVALLGMGIIAFGPPLGIALSIGDLGCSMRLQRHGNQPALRQERAARSR